MLKLFYNFRLDVFFLLVLFGATWQVVRNCSILREPCTSREAREIILLRVGPTLFFSLAIAILFGGLIILKHAPGTPGFFWSTQIDLEGIIPVYDAKGMHIHTPGYHPYGHFFDNCMNWYQNVAWNENFRIRGYTVLEPSLQKNPHLHYVNIYLVILALLGVVATGALSLYLKTKDVLYGNRIRARALTKRE